VYLKKFEKAAEAYVIDQMVALPPTPIPENIDETDERSTFNTRATLPDNINRTTERSTLATDQCSKMREEDTVMASEESDTRATDQY